MCIVGSAPGTPCTMDSSSLRSHRRLGCDATNTTLRERQRAHDDAVTSHAAALSIDMPSNGPSTGTIVAVHLLRVRR